jgi:peptide/nickel transport system substrate-binding protein
MAMGRGSMPSYNSETRSFVFRSGERVSRRWLLKLAAGAASGAALSAVLAACGGDDDDDDAPAATATTVTSGGATTTSGAAPTATSATTEGQPKTGGTLRIGYLEPPTLDPQYHASSSAGNIIGLIYDSLLIQDPYTSEYIAGPLTESFEVSQDTKTWTFHLKPGITYHDGTAVTAGKIAEIYAFAADPANASWVTGIYLPPSPTFEAPDDATLTISSPDPYGPMASHLFWDAWMGIFPPEARAKFGDDYGRNPIGTGPFKFVEWAAGDHLTLERNPDYKWEPAFMTNKGPAYLDKLELKFTSEQSTIVNGLQSGEFDLAFLPNEFYDQFASDSNFEIITRPSGRLDCIGWNMEHWPFTDLKTRQALMYGFDREHILEVMHGGHGQVTYGMIVPALPHYWAGEQEAGQKFDRDKAKAMLAEAGWADSDGDGVLEMDGKPFKLTLISGGTEEQVRWSSVVQDQAKQLGIDVQIETLEDAALNARRNDGDYDLYFFAYDTVDPDIIWFFFHSAQIPKEGGSGLNWGRVNDAKLDELIIKQRNNVGANRDSAVEEMVRHMMDQAFVLPLYAPDKNTVFNKKVKGVIYYPNAMDWELTEAWIDE